MKWRRFRHYFGIGAPQLEVHSRFAGYAHALGGALAAFALVLALSLFPRERVASLDDVSALRARIADLEKLIDEGEQGTLSTNLEVTYSANRQLSETVRLLSDNQAVLEDDLSHALRLVPVGASAGGTRLDRFVIWPDAASAQTYHYSVLIGYESGRNPQEFKGRLQFVLTVSREGKEAQRVWPVAKERQEYEVSVRHWVRKTGTLETLPGDVLRKVELKLMQGAAQRASATATL
jgi:hypothetical protein